MSPETEQQSDVVEAAMSLIKLASDPVATEARLKALSKAIEDSNAAAERSKAAEAAADAAEKRANAVLSEIAARETNFQSWHDQTTAALRSHEEATHAARAAAADWHQSLANREDFEPAARRAQKLDGPAPTASGSIRRRGRAMSDPAAYETLSGLVALLADGKATAKRIDELRKLEERTAAAQAKFDAEKAAHDRAAAAAEAEMIAREAAVRKREVDVAIWGAARIVETPG
jgi:hypothetical protein